MERSDFYSTEGSSSTAKPKCLSCKGFDIHMKSDLMCTVTDQKSDIVVEVFSLSTWNIYLPAAVLDGLH